MQALSCAFLILFSSTELSARLSCSYSWTTSHPASLLSANLINLCRLQTDQTQRSFRRFLSQSMLSSFRKIEREGIMIFHLRIKEKLLFVSFEFWLFRFYFPPKPLGFTVSGLFSWEGILLLKAPSLVSI